MPPHHPLLFLLLLLLFLVPRPSSCSVRGDYTPSRLSHLRSRVRRMFDHAYEGYLRHAHPYDELRPLSCDGVDTWGSYQVFF